MSHQPFEDSIFTDYRSSEEDSKLHEHLAGCEACSTLYQSLHSFESVVNIVGMQQPAAGFVNRWHQMLVERRLNEQSLMVRRFFLFLGAANVVTFLIIMIFSLVSGSPVNWLINTLVEVNKSVIWAGILFDAAKTFFANIPVIVPLIGLFLTGLILLVILAFWVLMVWRLSTKGVRNE